MRKISLVVHGTESLLRAIDRECPLLPAGAVNDALKRRDIKVNGERVSANIKVRDGDTITLYTSAGNQEIPIIYEDADCMIVNKPAGVNSDENSRSGFSLISWARQREQGQDQAELVHRLDNRTSGLMLIAKRHEAAVLLKGMMKDQTIAKQYVCLVRGCPEPPEARMAAWLKKDAKNARVSVFPMEVKDGKPIVTEYRVLEPGRFSRLQVTLHTGRTHQIRAHLAFLGYPVLGDDVYGDREANRLYRARQLKLCANGLGFGANCPVEGLRNRVFRIEAPF